MKSPIHSFAILPLIMILACDKAEDPKEQLPCDQEKQYCWEYEVIAKPNAIMRSEANPNSKVIAKIPFGITVKVIERTGPKVRLLGLQGNWLRVQSGTQVGWVFSRLLVPDLIKADPLVVRDGVAHFLEPRGKDPTPLPGKTLTLIQTYGHDVRQCAYTFSQENKEVTEICCGRWSGPLPEEAPPEAREATCNTKVFEIKGDEKEFEFDGKTYTWHPRLGGYVPQETEYEWKTIFDQAFRGQIDPEGDDYNWQHHPDSCRFCKGICYGDIEANYLCDLGRNGNTMQK